MNGPTPLALEVSGIRKSFGGNEVLRGTTFDVRPGTICALMGENGSGKTTTLNIISGLIGMDDGRLRLLGHDVTGMPPHRIARLGLGRTFQIPQLITDATVRENIEAGLLRRYPTRLEDSVFRPRKHAAGLRGRRAAAEAICDRLGLPESLRSVSFSAIPLGMRRMVEVGRALAAGSELICLDEPTAGLNEHELTDLGQLLRTLRETGTTVLIIEHTVRFVLAYCDDIVLMNRGSVQQSYRDFRDQQLPGDLARYLGITPGPEQPR